MRTSLLSCLVLLTLAGTASASTPWDRWRIAAEESRIEPYLGREALLLRNGIAWLDGSAFRDGTVSFDLAMSAADASFDGLMFRAVDDANYEHVYLRPHLSGKPDATQYQPIFNGEGGWQIYSGPRFQQPATIAGDRWIHVEIRVLGRRLEMSVDGQMLVFPQLVRPVTTGRIGVGALGAAAHFANVEIDADTPPRMSMTAGAQPAAMPAGIVPRWRVSTPFAESRIDGESPLNPHDWPDLRWDVMESGVGGIANLAMLRTRTPERNTVFATVTVHADRPAMAHARFGFSDRVTVFLDGRPLYRGRDEFASRDDRFLGTVGLFDELVLPLDRGDHEIRFAVSEDFGGWAVLLQLPETNAVRVVQP